MFLSLGENRVLIGIRLRNITKLKKFILRPHTKIAAWGVFELSSYSKSEVPLPAQTTVCANVWTSL